MGDTRSFDYSSYKPYIILKPEQLNPKPETHVVKLCQMDGLRILARADWQEVNEKAGLGFRV